MAPSTHPAHLSFANRPQQSGWHIFRDLGQGFTVLVDDGSGLTLTAGLLASPADLCVDPDAVVASQDFLQFNGTPSGALHLLAINKELHVVVYGIASEDFCALAEAEVVAAGTARFLFTNNDLLLTGGATNSFGARFEGLVELTGGGAARLQGSYQFRIRDSEFLGGFTVIRLNPGG